MVSLFYFLCHTVNEKLQNVTLLNRHQFILAEIDFFCIIRFLFVFSASFFNGFQSHSLQIRKHGSHVKCYLRALTLSIGVNPNARNIDINNGRFELKPKKKDEKKQTLMFRKMSSVIATLCHCHWKGACSCIALPFFRWNTFYFKWISVTICSQHNNFRKVVEQFELNAKLITWF